MSNLEIVNNYKKANGITGNLCTFKEWNRLGYKVKKGEKSKHQLKLWKRVKVNSSKEDGGLEDSKKDSKKTNRWFLVNACLFTDDQVQAK